MSDRDVIRNLHSKEKHLNQDQFNNSLKSLFKERMNNCVIDEHDKNVIDLRRKITKNTASRSSKMPLSVETSGLRLLKLKFY